MACFFFQILGVLNSNEDFDFDDGFVSEIERVPFTGGAGCSVRDNLRKTMVDSLKEYCKRNISVWSPQSIWREAYAVLQHYSWGQCTFKVSEKSHPNF